MRYCRLIQAAVLLITYLVLGIQRWFRHNPVLEDLVTPARTRTCRPCCNVIRAVIGTEITVEVLMLPVVSNRIHNSRCLPKQCRASGGYIRVYLTITEAAEVVQLHRHVPFSSFSFLVPFQCFLINFILKLVPFEFVWWLLNSQGYPQKENCCLTMKLKSWRSLWRQLLWSHVTLSPDRGKYNWEANENAKLRTFREFSLSLKIGVSLILALLFLTWIF